MAQSVEKPRSERRASSAASSAAITRQLSSSGQTRHTRPATSRTRRLPKRLASTNATGSMPAQPQHLRTSSSNSTTVPHRMQIGPSNVIRLSSAPCGYRVRRPLRVCSKRLFYANPSTLGLREAGADPRTDRRSDLDRTDFRRDPARRQSGVSSRRASDARGRESHSRSASRLGTSRAVTSGPSRPGRRPPVATCRRQSRHDPARRRAALAPRRASDEAARGLLIPALYRDWALGMRLPPGPPSASAGSRIRAQNVRRRSDERAAPLPA